MRRRDFIILGGTAAAWPLAAQGQQPGRLPTIGYLDPGFPSQQTVWRDAFLQRLNELGWVEGRTVTVDYRWAEGHRERYAEIASEFVRRKVDVIVTQAAEPSLAVKRATINIPIVSVAVGDLVGAGLVASLPRPGGNVTGLSMQNTDLAGKRVELVRQLVPELHRLAVLAETGNPANTLTLDETRLAARTLGLEVIAMEVGRPEDIAPAFEQLNGGAQALFVAGGPLVNLNRVRVLTLAMGARLPTIFNTRESVEAGGLMSYGPNLPDMHRRSADLVDKILRGTKPADIPVEQPTKFDLVINTTTAKVLGVNVPPTMLAIADEVID
jgi:putative ABC transport system substrate-binding protein